MSTFLELVQAVNRESGTVPDFTLPTTVVGQTGRLARLVHWTRRGYADIQTKRKDWRWLRREFAGQTEAGTRRYGSNDTRFDHWIFNSTEGRPSFSIYRTSEGRAGEGWLRFVPWDEFRRLCLTGAAAEEIGQPTHVSVDPDDRLVLYPTPEDAYTLSGEYYRGPQMLAADADVPEMPATHHEAIVWRALLLMGTFDEAPEQMASWQQMFREHWEGLLHTQTPAVTLAGPLA